MVRSWRLTTVAAFVTLAMVGLTSLESRPSEATGLVTGPELTAAVRTQLADERGVYRLSVRELGGANRTIDIDGGHAMEPASSIKIFYAWLALKRVDSGRLSLSARLPSGVTWGKCLEVMIVVSDNLCSADIREALGNRWVNRAFANAGFDDTRVLLSPTGAYRGKRSSAADLTDFLVELESGNLLSSESTARMHELLRGQVWRTRIGGGTPQGVMVESKPGQLAVNNRMVETDAAIVRGPYSTYVISVMGENNAKKSAIRNISQIVYEGLQGESVALRASYPRAQYVARRNVGISSAYRGSVAAIVPSGRPVQLKLTSRLDAYVHVDGIGWGWVPFSRLRLRDEYRWLG